ncbi:cupin domain-containing protein [Amycolatopsis sp. NPDC054798]
MARIHLDPGEEFEHYHSTASTSTLEEGSAEIRHPGGRQELVTGRPITTPARTSHVIVNTGSGVAIINCGCHAPPPN